MRTDLGVNRWFRRKTVPLLVETDSAFYAAAAPPMTWAAASIN